MKLRKGLSAFLAVICILSSFGFSALGASAEGTEAVYATTSSSLTQGSYGYTYVYLDDLTDLGALTVSVYYDTDKITVKSLYNQVACELYDSSNTDGCVQFSYLFDGEGGNTKTNLFYFQYQVNGTAEAGDTFFDVVVSDAYTASSLDPVPLVGSRCPLTITEKAVTKSCSVYSTSSLSTSVKEEFTLSYRLSTVGIASGNLEITYDRELFEVVSVTAGAFLDGKLSDVNADLDGTISLSFVGTEYGSKSDLVSVTFKTLKNLATTSEIKLTVKEFYDLELNSLSCGGYKTTATLVFDETYTEDAPSVTVSAVYSEESEQVSAQVTLEKDSHLGACDFVLRFDPEALTYVSATKGFSATLFTVNDKNVESGVLKFSLLSTTDIVDEKTVLTVVFDAKRGCADKTAELALSGNGVTDALTNPILLNFVSTDVTLPLLHRYTEEGDCSVCGEYRATFAGASLTLEDDLAVNFKTDAAQFVGTEYSDPFVVFTFNGRNLTVTEHVEEANGRYAFTFRNIDPRMMNDSLVATLYATYLGEPVVCQVKSYSIKQYCQNMLARCEDGGIYADHAAFKTLLVDLLNYGAATQVYTDYRTEEPVNADLTDTQKAWATQTSPLLSDKQDLTYRTAENASVYWRAVGLQLVDSVSMRFKMRTTSTDGLSVKIYTDANPEGWVIDSEDFVATEDAYYVYFDGLKARQMREVVYVTAYRDGVAVSDTIAYSIESYAYAMKDSADKTLTALLDAMMKYGDAAYQYING